MSHPVKLFISYSHKDESLLRMLQDHLEPMRREALISDWHDRRIIPGDDWHQEISEHLEGCRVVLLLLSANFFASAYIQGAEMAAALRLHHEGKVRLIPIILRPVDWETTSLGKFQALPSNARAVTGWKDRHQAFREVARGVRAVLTNLDPGMERPDAHVEKGATRSTYFLNHTSFLRAERQEEFRARTGVPLDHYDIRVILDAEEPEMLDAVSKVEYQLHDAYPEPLRTRLAEHDLRSKFLLKELANGEFLLRATVHFADDKRPPMCLERYITLWDSGPELP